MKFISLGLLLAKWTLEKPFTPSDLVTASNQEVKTGPHQINSLPASQFIYLPIYFSITYHLMYPSVSRGICLSIQLHVPLLLSICVDIFQLIPIYHPLSLTPFNPLQHLSTNLSIHPTTYACTVKCSREWKGQGKGGGGGRGR